MKRFILLAIIVSLFGGSISGCMTQKQRLPSKRDLVYGYESIVEEEAAGKPAFPQGNTWERYWKTRFQYLRAVSSNKKNYEDVISFVKALRREKGLPPVE